MNPARALTIAGSDSGGGAGIQADLKTFAALGVYGASVITAITAQNTVEVRSVFELPASLISEQIDAVVSDIGFDAYKTGMLSSSAIIEVVARKALERGLTPLVVDPVMVAKAGDKLLRDDAVEALRSLLLPLATVVTPNIPEAEALAGHRISTLIERREAARRIRDLGPRSVVIKGGHLDGPAVDLFFDGQHFMEFPVERVPTVNTHGTGCTFASAITAELAKGANLLDAVGAAKRYVTEAIAGSYPLGHGHGPVHHFVRWWPV